MPDPRLVLVVSDDPLIRQEAEYGFPTDVRVELVTDSRQAMRLMRDNLPACVLVDIQTGSAGGFSLARDMAQTKHLRDVPILMLLEREHDAWLARQSGAKSFRVKPIETGDLVAAALGMIPDAA